MRGGKYGAGGADSDLVYDDSAFKLFAVAILAVYWLPAGIYRLVRFLRRVLHKKDAMEVAKEAWCTCSQCQNKADKIRTKTSGLKGLSIGDYIFCIFTILLLFSAVRVYRSNIRSGPPFDPFEILDVSKSASSKEIKRAYRRLSVIHHPDKNRDDPDGAAERFMRISKAYAALTDETAKKNYIKFGNPDGYLGTTWGLGLPEWVGSSSKSVLLLYAIFMVIIFPTMVAFWWHRSMQQLTPGLMTSTFMKYRATLHQTSRFRDMLNAFCGSDEFNALYTTDNDEYLNELQDTLRKDGCIPKAKSVFEPSHSQFQNILIMTAYLARLPVPGPLNHVLENILSRSESLMTSLTDIVGTFPRKDCMAAWNRVFMQGHTTLLSRCLHLTQCVYQALDEKSSPLLQIPHFTEREVRSCTTRYGGTKSVYDLVRMDMSDLRKLLRDLTDSQLLDVKSFLDRFPSASLQVEPPCVEGEDDPSVHEGDTVTVRVTLRVLRRSGSAFSPHVPRLPYRKEEVWWLWIADHRRMCPIEVRRLLPRMARGHDGTKRRGFEEEDGEEDDFLGDGSVTAEERKRRKRREEEVEQLAADPRVTVFEVAFKFPAPKKSSYTLEVKAVCDCYASATVTHLMNMDVLDAVEVKEEVRFSTDEESGSDEDSEEDEDASEDGNDGDDEREIQEENGEHGSDDEYEYIEVTASESEPGDFDDDDNSEDDDFGVSDVSKGDPSAH